MSEGIWQICSATGSVLVVLYEPVLARIRRIMMVMRRIMIGAIADEVDLAIQGAEKTADWQCARTDAGQWVFPPTAPDGSGSVCVASLMCCCGTPPHRTPIAISAS